MAEAKDDYSGGDKLNASEVNKISESANDAGGFRDDKLAGETINGATLSVPVYQNTTDNEFYACDANVSTKLNFVGFAISNSTDGNAIDLQMSGIVSGFTGLDEGEKYYVQDAVGTIGKVKGTYEVLVGIAISATELLIFRNQTPEFNGGSFLFASNDVNKNPSPYDDTWVKAKEIQIYKGGRIKTSFHLALGSASSMYGKIYVNGVAVGAEHSGGGSFTDYIEILAGDLIQVYTKTVFSSGTTPSTLNFRIYVEAFERYENTLV